MFNEFKKFISRGNVVDMAVGIIIGAAFVSIVNSLIADIIMPPIGLLLGNVDFSNLFVVLKGDHYSSLAEAKAAGAVTINYGYFINQLVSFLLISMVIFLFVKSINKLRAPETVSVPAPATKECTYCKMEIPINATKCPHCTSDLI